MGGILDFSQTEGRAGKQVEKNKQNQNKPEQVKPGKYKGGGKFCQGKLNIFSLGTRQTVSCFPSTLFCGLVFRVGRDSLMERDAKSFCAQAISQSY